jgi:hypothetical protein
MFSYENLEVYKKAYSQNQKAYRFLKETYIAELCARRFKKESASETTPTTPSNRAMV